MTTMTEPTLTAMPATISEIRPADQGVPMSRLVKVEVRKSIDTRAGKWLLGIMVGGTAVAMAIMIAVGIANDNYYEIADFLLLAGWLIGLLLPVLGILSVTGEWSQRTNMVTFTLEPRRSRIVAAKLITGIVMSLAAAAVGAVIGILALGVFHLAGGATTWSVPVAAIAGFVILQVIGLLTGFAFGMIILNTPAAIVSFFVCNMTVPIVFVAAAANFDRAERIRPWIDFDLAQLPLVSGQFGDVNWTQFAVAGLIWLAIPVAFGIRRTLRAEVK
jgi:ABC-2 type transport system permease protein